MTYSNSHDSDGVLSRSNIRSHRIVVGFVFVIALSLVAGVLGAQTVPTGFQEYFILAYDQHMWDFMNKVVYGEPTPPGPPPGGQGGGPLASGMQGVVTATVSSNNQVIYYDHWEDGLETDIFNPLQASTIIIGDAVLTNGDACDFSGVACGTDILSRGDYLNFNSDRALGTGCTKASVSPLVFTHLCASVPMNPRCVTAGACTAAELRFDGGDLLVASGGPVSLIHSQWPMSQYIGGATEIISRQAVEAARSYSVPVGQDLYVSNTGTEPFHYVDLNLVAYEDGTSVLINSPVVGGRGGTISFTLNRGEHWSSLGYIDDNPRDTSINITINSGTKVSTSAPISGLMFTGGDGRWATRHYALLPDLLHSTDYVLTAPGEDPNYGIGDPGEDERPLDVYIFNPDPLNALDVYVTDTVGTVGPVSVPANSVVDYFAATGSGRYIPYAAPDGSTVRLFADRNFWGISAYDYNTNISDWGHSWLARKFLTGNYTVSWAPGNSNQPPSTPQKNGVYVSATQNNTRVKVDFDNDGLYDVIDMDGATDDCPEDGAFTDGTCDPTPPAVPVGCPVLASPTRCIYTVNALRSLRVFDWTDWDNTGTRVVANKPVALAYGQDIDLSDYNDVALDTGFSVYPVNQAFLDPVLTIAKSVDVGSVVTTGGIRTYTIKVKTYDFGPITNVLVWDLLPATVLGSDYVPGSTLITYPDLTQDTTDPALSTDAATGLDRLDWFVSGPGHPDPSTMGTNQTLTITYQVDIPAAPGAVPRQLTNTAYAEGTYGGSFFSPEDTAEVVQTDVTILKTLDFVGLPGPGDRLTYHIQVANGGINAETSVIITDPIPSDTIFVPGSISNGSAGSPFSAGSFDPAQNAVVWTTNSFAAGSGVPTPWDLSFQVDVNPGVVSGSVISNQANYESYETPLLFSNVVVTTFGPALDISKVGPEGPLHPNEVATFDILVENTGVNEANNVLINDPFPPNTTYVSESMSWSLNAEPFTSVSDAADSDEGTEFVDRLELALTGLGIGENIVFRFQVNVTPGTAGRNVRNQATVSSDEVSPKDSNLVQIPIVGDADIDGHVFLDSNGNGVQDGGEPNLANLDVTIASVQEINYSNSNSGAAVTDGGYDGTLGSMGCTTINVPTGPFGATPAITDLDLQISVNQTWVGDLTIKVVNPGGEVLTVLNRPGSPAPDDGTDQPYGNPSVWNGDILTFDDAAARSAELVGSIGTTVCSIDGFCDYFPAPGTASGLSNLAGYNSGDPRGDWQVCLGDSAGGDAPTFNSAALFFTTADVNDQSNIFTVTTDANGDWLATVEPGSTSANVDETDPDFPSGATLTTANDPQIVLAITGSTVSTGDVGYQPPAITFTKISNTLLSQVVPGQTVTYTLTAVNNTGVLQTNVVLTDTVPTGTTYRIASSSHNDPANLIIAADAIDIAIGGTLVVTLDVLVDKSLDSNISQIVNTATLSTDQTPPTNASVTDNVVRPAVTVEYDNAGYVLADPADTVILYSHEIVNQGTHNDSFEITVDSALGYKVELIDPETEVTIATDIDGDGIWDIGGPVNTGTLAPGAGKNYDVRVMIPGGTPAGTQEKTTLFAVSDLDSTVTGKAVDETLVIDSLDPVIVLPDNSGVVAPGDTVSYNHWIINNTGGTDTFDLSVVDAIVGGPGDPADWTTTFYYDNDANGVYTPGIDIAVTNTLQLQDGERQLIFMVVDAPLSAAPDDTHVAHITVTSRADTDLFDAVTDTTTAPAPVDLDLSGGGSRTVTPGNSGIFPGTLSNYTSSADRYDMDIDAAWFAGVDGLNHGTQLWLDTTGNGIPDTQIAEDLDGDGAWDSIAPGYDALGNGNPDFSVAPGSTVSYELRRPVDLNQGPIRDPVTMTAISQGDSAQVDSITATVIVAATLTHAVLASFDAFSYNGMVVLDWRTVSNVGTIGFRVLRATGKEGIWRQVNSSFLEGLLHSPQGGRYLFVDDQAVAGKTYTYRLVEYDYWGDERHFGPFKVKIVDRSNREDLPSLSSGYVKLPNESTVRTGNRADNPVVTGTLSGKVKIEVQGSGLVLVETAALATALNAEVTEVSSWIADHNLQIGTTMTSVGVEDSSLVFSDGFETGNESLWSSLAGKGTTDDADDAEGAVAWMAAPDNSGVMFYAEILDSIYSNKNVYWLAPGKGLQMAHLAGLPPQPVGDSSFHETLHLEEEQWPLTSAISDPEGDFWMWDYVFAGGTPGAEQKTIDLHIPGAVRDNTTAILDIQLQAASGSYAAQEHHVLIGLNGKKVGEARWNGPTSYQLRLAVSQNMLREGINQLELTGLLIGDAEYDFGYLNEVEVEYARYCTAENDTLKLIATGSEALSVQGFSSDEIVVFEISEPQQPVVLDATVIDNNGSYRVSFNAIAGAHYLATTLAGAISPFAVRADFASDLKNPAHSANYLVIAAQGLEPAAQQLAAYRSSRGLKGLVVRLDDVYDEFNDGIVDPWAIRELLDYAVNNWTSAPQYVVLAGDSSFDFKDHMGAGGNLLLSPMVNTPRGLVPSDNQLADLSGNDGVPEVAIGRLPVQTNDELSDYVSKLITSDAAGGSWRTRTTWLSDNSDEGGNFAASNEELISLLAPHLEAKQINLDELDPDTARQDLFTAINDGTRLLNFLGHGGFDRLADEGLLIADDAALLGNGHQPMIMTALTCSVGRTDYPGVDSLSEALLLAPDSGAIGIWSATGLVLNADGVKVGQALFSSPAKCFGDIARKALATYLNDPESEAYVPYVYTLIGDPATDLGISLATP